MNKYQALLDELCIGCSLTECKGGNTNCRLYLGVEELVDRATPKKPIGTYTNYRCPVCGTRVRSGKGSSSRTKDTVCRNCFQVLDWSEEDV